MADFKQCPSCGAHHPPTHAFCPICGASLHETAVQSLYGSGKEHYWEIPDFLLEASKWQRTRDLGASGSGLLWIGGLLAAVPFLIDPSEPLAIGAFAAGLAIIGMGLLRMRNSARTLARAGIIANGGAFLALALVVGRVIVAPAETISPTVTPVAAAVEESSASAESNGISIAGEAPMYRGDPAHTGVLSGPAPVGHPEITWRYDSGGEITSTAAVADGLIFFTGKRGEIFAVDAVSGEIRWQKTLENYVLGSSPAVVDGAVYVAGGYKLYSFEAATGKERWTLPIQYSAQSSPTVSGNMVYIASQDGKVYGVDARTGEQQWSNGDIKGLVFGAPAVSGPYIFVGTDGGEVLALSATTGNRIWKTPVGGTIFASPAVSGTTLIVTSRGSTTTDSLTDAAGTTPAAGTGGGSIFALNIADGKLLWTYGVAGASSAAISGNLVIVGGDDGGVHALDLESGEQRWLAPTGNPVTSSPVIVGDLVYIASGLNLYGLDLTTGQSQWRFSATDTISASPAIANSQIYIGSQDGFLYAIGGDGKQ